MFPACAPTLCVTAGFAAVLVTWTSAAATTAWTVRGFIRVIKPPARTTPPTASTDFDRRIIANLPETNCQSFCLCGISMRPPYIQVPQKAAQAQAWRLQTMGDWLAQAAVKYPKMSTIRAPAHATLIPPELLEFPANLGLIPSPITRPEG